MPLQRRIPLKKTLLICGLMLAALSVAGNEIAFAYSRATAREAT